MHADVLLVNAPAEKIKERHYEQPDIPRIGLAYLASYLLHSGIGCAVIDAKYEKIDASGVLERIGTVKPAIVGFTAMTTEIMDAARLAALIKKTYPAITTVIGGPHASALPIETLREFGTFDIAVFGEGEETLRDITQNLVSKTSLQGIDGIAYREKGQAITLNKPRPFMADLDRIPPPAWHLFSPSKKYPILGSRGCPFRCNFCMRVLGDRIRFRNPDLVMQEMKEIYEKYRPAVFEFDDETFGIDKQKTYRLLEGIIESGLSRKIRWHIQTRVDVVSEELLSKMKEAGCEWVGFGVESGSERILHATHKSITKERVRRAIAMAKRAGLQTGSFFILGHPHETRETIRETIDFALELNTSTVAFGIMMPYPGTVIAKMAEEGRGGYRLLSKNWTDYNKQTSDVLELEQVSGDTLQRYQLLGYMKFYLFKPSIGKIRNLLEFVDPGSILKMLVRRLRKQER